MSEVTANQPEGTPTWVDLGIPDLDRAMEFYRALFGWEYDVGPAGSGRYTTCLLRGRPVAGVFGLPAAPVSRWATTFEVADTDAVAGRARAAGGTVGDVQDMVYGRIATITDPFGAEFSVIARPPGVDPPA
jgi:uncharacterized protein